MLLDQSHRVARVEVVGEDEHADLGVCVADLLRRDEPLVGVRRRHLDVDDRDLRPGELDLAPKLLRRSYLAHDLEPCFGQKPPEPFPEQHLVVGDYDSHGISARIIT